MEAIFGHAFDLERIAATAKPPIDASTAARMVEIPIALDADSESIMAEYLDRARSSKPNANDWALIRRACSEEINRRASLLAERDKLISDRREIERRITALKKQSWSLYQKIHSVEYRMPKDDRIKERVQLVWTRIVRRCAAIKNAVVKGRLKKYAKGEDESLDEVPDEWTDELIEKAARSSIFGEPGSGGSEVEPNIDPEGLNGGGEANVGSQPTIDDGCKGAPTGGDERRADANGVGDGGDNATGGDLDVRPGC